VIEEIQRAAGRRVSRETYEKLEAYVALINEESCRQNLVSAATLSNIWSRHIADSAQLVRFEPRAGASWIDLGSGAGLPGIVIACLAEGPVTLVEPRRLRAEFLHKAAESLELRVAVHPQKAERVSGTFDVITARALAPLPTLLDISHHLSTGKTVWALPKGRTATSELADAKRAWQGVFHVERSVTDEDARIIVATGVKKR
jgi:16S rRNA (guanine527-N7)-methyltransferase